MARPERSLDPEAGPVQRFATELRELRKGADGVTYRAMAERVGYAAATLSEAAAGERLPSLAVTLAYVRACRGDEEEWERRWRQVSDEVDGQLPAEDGAVAPYPGLARFETGDRDRFFGRDALLADLMELASTHRFTALVGTSGSGKSSLLRAGLIPALMNGAAGNDRPATIRILTPGERPATTHAVAFRAVDGDGDTWVLVDQFEEVFTLCQDTGERSRFMDLVLSALRPGSRLRVVIAVRADFYGRCGEHRELAGALRTANLLITPMSAEELREAIVKPAAAAGLILERALTARIIEDVVHEPGGLPLMSHALLETWRRRRGRTLTLKGYETAGGVQGAIALTAEDVYARLSPEQAARARGLLLRLVAPGEGAQDTRRPARRSELAAWGTADAAQVLDQLARARLVTLDEDTVDLAHEALITAWPRLRSWIDRDRELLRHHRRLTEAAAAWEELRRDPGALYRGARLAAAEEAFGTPEAGELLTPLERSFLEASVTARRQEQRAATRTTRRLRALTATLSVLLVLAVTAVAVAVGQRQEAVSARGEALSRQLAAQSGALLDSDPDLASLLAVASYRTHPTTEAVTGLYTAAALPLRRVLRGHAGQVWSVAFSADGRTLATAGDDLTVRLWNTSDGSLRATLTGHDGVVPALAFSPDGRTLATGGGKTVRLWDAATGKARRTVPTGHDGGVTSLAFSPDGRTLATAGFDTPAVLGKKPAPPTHPSVRLWDIKAVKVRATLSGHIGEIWSVAFSRDGRTLATASEDRTARLWDTATGTARAVLTGHTGPVRSVAFDPDGRTVATGGWDRTVRLWDVATGKGRVIPAGHTRPVLAVAFSPDGRTLATGGTDKTARLWDVATGTSRATLSGHSASVTSLAFSPDGHTLATGSEDFTARLWDAGAGPARTTLTDHTGPVRSVALSPDGRTLAAGSDDGKARLWDTATGTLRAALTGHTGPVRSVAFSPDGRTVATGGVDGTVRLWDAATGAGRATFSRYPSSVWSVTFAPGGRTLATRHDNGVVRLWNTATGKGRDISTGHGKPVWSLAFSPDGRTLATGAYDKTIRLTDVRTGETRAVLTGHTSTVKSVAFSPDGRTLASSGEDRTARLWDVTTGKLRTTLSGHSEQVWAVAFSPDGRTLATGGDDGTARLWDVATGKARAVLTGHTGPVRSVAFGPDGRTVATGGSDGTARLWSVTLPDPDGAIRAICRALHRDLTRAERSAYLPDGSVPVCRTP